MSKFFSNITSFLAGNPDLVLSEPATSLPGVEPTESRQKRIGSKLAQQRAEAKAKKAQEAEALAEAKAAAEAKAKKPLHEYRQAAIQAAGLESRSLSEYADKLASIYGADMWKHDLSDRGMKKMSGNEKTACEPMAAERRTFIEGLKSEAYNSKGFTYWQRVMDFVKLRDPNAPKIEKTPKTAMEAARSGIETTWVRLNKSKEYADEAKNTKLVEINELLEAALLLTGVRDIQALRTKKEI